MSRTRVWMGTCSAWLGVLAACASPHERLYSLGGESDDPRVAAATLATVLVAPVSIPLEVDRPQIMLRAGSNQLVASEQERWAAPLRDVLPGVMAADLDRQGLGMRFVPASSAARLVPSATLAMDVTSLELSRTRGATLIVHWVYRASGSERPPVEADAHARVDAAKAGYDGLVDALREACAQVAQQIATGIR